MSQPVETAGTTSSGAAARDLFEDLESTVRRLLSRSAASERDVETLRGQLRDGEARIAELRDRIEALTHIRDQAQRRLEGLIRDVERLEREAVSG